MMFLFVRDDSFTSNRFTTMTEHLTKQITAEADG